jgi:hypothetical protein
MATSKKQQKVEPEKAKIGAPKKEVSLATLANLWGQSIPAVSNDLKKLGLSIDVDGWAACTKAKISSLRETARGRTTAGGEDLMELKAEETRTRIELNNLQIAREAGQVVEVAKLEPMLADMVTAFRVEILATAEKIFGDFEVTQTLDVDLVHAHLEEALEHLTRYEPILHGTVATGSAASEAATEDFDDELG